MHACLMCFREEDQTVALHALQTYHGDLWRAVMALRQQAVVPETSLQTASMFDAQALLDSQQGARPM